MYLLIQQHTFTCSSLICNVLNVGKVMLDLEKFMTRMCIKNKTKQNPQVLLADSNL